MLFDLSPGPCSKCSAFRWWWNMLLESDSIGRSEPFDTFCFISGSHAPTHKRHWNGEVGCSVAQRVIWQCCGVNILHTPMLDKDGSSGYAHWRIRFLCFYTHIHTCTMRSKAFDSNSLAHTAHSSTVSSKFGFMQETVQFLPLKGWRFFRLSLRFEAIPCV